MLRDEYVINITSRQVYHDGSGDTGEFTLNLLGTYTRRGGVRFIAYKEHYDPQKPQATITTVLKVEPGKVTMMRSGTATRLILELGKRHRCLYDTGYGNLLVGLYTSELTSTLGEEGGTLAVKYTLDVDSSLSSSNEILVDVKRGLSVPAGMPV